MKLRVLVLGAGFGGLELTTILSEELGDQLDLVLIDQHESFYFGYSKFEVMFGRKTSDEIKIAYRHIVKPGVRFRQETITHIDPVNKRATTNAGTYEADVLVISLGANYDISATPGLAEGANEFYSLAGVQTLRGVLPGFSKGRVVVGVCGAPFKCPPAPSEAALLTHDYLVQRGIRADCEISLVMPFSVPIPPSPDSSVAILSAFAERNISFIPKKKVVAIEPGGKIARMDDGTEMPFDLFLGIPRHRAPAVVESSILAVNGWIPVDPKNLKTNYPGVWAIGDVTSVGTPKAGVFAEGAAKIAAASIIASLKGTEEPDPYAGAGTCYLEFGGGKVGKVDVNFFSGPKPTGSYTEASLALNEDKKLFGSTRRRRWFGVG